MLPLAKFCIPSRAPPIPFPVIDARKQSCANKEDLVFVEKLFRTVLLMTEECYESTPSRYSVSCDVAASDAVRAVVRREVRVGTTLTCSGLVYLLRFLLLSGDPAVLSISIPIGAPIS